MVTDTNDETQDEFTETSQLYGQEWSSYPQLIQSFLSRFSDRQRVVQLTENVWFLEINDHGFSAVEVFNFKKDQAFSYDSESGDTAFNVTTIDEWKKRASLFYSMI